MNTSHGFEMGQAPGPDREPDPDRYRLQLSEQADKATALSGYWMVHLVDGGLCAICRNQGRFVSMVTGRKMFCICPNGRGLREMAAWAAASFTGFCYGKLVGGWDSEAEAKTAMTEHVHTCPQGEMPWADPVEWIFGDGADPVTGEQVVGPNLVSLRWSGMAGPSDKGQQPTPLIMVKLPYRPGATQ